MDRIKEVTERWLATAEAAAKRWQKREPDRTGASQRYLEGGPEAADTAERIAQFRHREGLRIRAMGFPVTKERQIGPTLDFTNYPPDEGARRAGRPVARIVELPQAGIIPQGFGTGFLVSPRLLLTNHHVLPTLAEARGVGANFLHEYASGGLQLGPIFELDPDSFFVNDERLDFALVAVKKKSGETALDSFSYVKLISARGKILVGHPIEVIQYPNGGPKQYATTQNKLLDVLEEGYLQYTTDTMPGSSGSPAFNQYWELVALHHSGVPLLENGKVIAKNGKPWDKGTMTQADVQWVANEGIRVSNIVEALGKVKMQDPARAAELKALLDSTADPLRTPGPQAERERVSEVPTRLPEGPTIHIAGDAHFYFDRESALRKAAERVADSSEVADAIEKKLRFDPNYDKRQGYDRQFLGVDIGLPTVEAALGKKLLQEGAKPVLLKYHHFSLVMHRERRLQVWSAVNVDYSPERKSKRDRSAFGTDTWVVDPRIAGSRQIQDADFYKPATKIDRGHIVRREDNAWGDTELEIEYANSDTFHWTNCTPQHEAFNQERRQGLWGMLEGQITSQVGAVGNRASIFAGPVLAENDPSQDYGYGLIQYPLRFWKVITCAEEVGGKPSLLAYGFLLDQSGPVKRFGIEAMEFGRFRAFQVALTTITGLTGVAFDKLLLAADVLAGQDAADERIPLEKFEQVRHRPAKKGPSSLVTAGGHHE